MSGNFQAESKHWMRCPPTRLRMKWTRLLLPLTSCLLSVNLRVMSAVLIVVGLLLIAGPIQARIAASTTYAALVAASPRTLMAWMMPGHYLSLTCRRITSAFIIGTSAFLNYCCTRAQFLRSTCKRLASASSTAGTPLSTKMSSEQYSDL